MEIFNKTAQKYTYRTMWSTEDGSFIATVAEFPSMSWIEDSPEETLLGLKNLIAEMMEDMSENNEPIPQPLGSREFSGKFDVRVGKSLHRSLVMRAEQEELSLNALVMAALAKQIQLT